MTKRILPFLLLALVAGAPMLQAQETTRERERKQEAERQLVEAQRQLERALEQVRAGNQEARQQLEQAMEALRAAQRQLYRDNMNWDVVVSPRRGEPGVFTYSGDWPAVAVFESDRPRIGVVLATERPVRDTLGAGIAAVTPGGPADQAGIKVGDVIIEANGQALSRRGRPGEAGDRLVEIVTSLKEGDSVRVRYRRGNEVRTTVIKPRKMGGDAFAYAFGDSSLYRPRFEIAPMIRERFEMEPGQIVSRLALSSSWMDLELVTLNADLGSYFGTDQGLLVVRGPRDATLGLRSGDVILQIDGREPTSPSHGLRILRSYENGEKVSLEIMRNKKKQTIQFTIPSDRRDRER